MWGATSVFAWFWYVDVALLMSDVLPEDKFVRCPPRQSSVDETKGVFHANIATALRVQSKCKHPTHYKTESRISTFSYCMLGLNPDAWSGSRAQRPT